MKFAPLLLCALALGACASSRPYGGHPEIALVQASELPAPGGGFGPEAGYRSTIGPYDTITVDILAFEQMRDRRFVVDGAGRITVPMAGTIQVGGMTTSEAVEAIRAGLRRNFVREPQVSVNFDEIRSNYVTVQGSVTQPGNYPVIEGMTLLRAVAAARGTNEVAKHQDVVVMRTVGGQRMAALYNLAAIERASYPDPAIYPQDTVIVGESPTRRLIQQVIQASPLLVSPVVALLQNNN